MSLALGGCTDVDGFTEAQWSVIETLSPRPQVPESPSNEWADDEAAAELGQRLYFDQRLGNALLDSHPGGPGGVGDEGVVACATCHVPEDDFSDTRGTPTWPTSLGVAWTPRNAPTVLDAAHYEWFLWDGRAASLWQAVTVAVEVGAAQNASRLRIAHHLANGYAAEYEDVFGEPLPDVSGWPENGAPGAVDPVHADDWQDLPGDDKDAANEILARFGKAIAAYLRLVVTGDSDFDDYVMGDRDAISDSAKRGLALFIGEARCVACHLGPSFTDNRFHNIGVPQEGEHVKPLDTGREEGLTKLAANTFSTKKLLERVEGEAGTTGAFRTPSLRNVTRTAPYMHTGGFASLEDVIRFYNWGGARDGYAGVQESIVTEPLDLDPVEQSDLLAFLQTLDGRRPPGRLRQDPRP